MLYRTDDTIEQFKGRVELVKGDVTNPVDVENTWMAPMLLLLLSALVTNLSQQLFYLLDSPI